MNKVDLPLFRSKFLHACADFLIREHGLGDIVPFAKLRGESFSASWDSGLTGDFPSFFSEDGGWSFDGRNDDGGIVMMDVTEHGAVTLRSLDGESQHLTTRIESPEELGEVMALFTSIKPTHLDAPNWTSFPLSSVIEQVFLVLPRDKRDVLVPFDARLLAKQQPELWRAIKILQNLKTEPDALNSLEYSCWADWVEKHADWKSLPEPTPPGAHDLFYSEDCGLHSWRLHAERETEFFDVAPKFALRINPKHSPMFFHLFTQQTREGATVLPDLAANLENVQAWLKRTQVNYPSSVVAQRRLAFEFRNLRKQYDERHESLVSEREPAKQLIELYEKRVRLIGRWHSEYIHEMEAALCPLPFFIEYPLHRWSMADDYDRMEQVVRAKQLLTILVKSIVLLPLEEALAQSSCPQSIRSLADNLSQKKPLSDGGWVELLGLLRKSCNEASLSLPLFGQLLAGSSAIESELNKLVAARNRFNHPPFDAQGMVKVFADSMPGLAAFLRKTISGIHFLMPQSLRVAEGRKLVRALVLSGFETEFHSGEREVTASLESFPSAKMIATDSAGARVLLLGRFFTSKSLKAETIDVGIFDRVEGDHSCFEFVRGLGNVTDTL